MNRSEIKMVITQCLNGEKNAYNRIIRHYQKPIFHFCFRFSGVQEEAEDAAVEIFLKAYRALGTFKSAYSFSAWLYKIALNHLIEKGRRKKRQEDYYKSEAGDRSHSATWETPDSVFFQQLKEEKVRAGLQAISLTSRTVLTLRYYHQFSYKQISRIMEVPKNTVASLIYRGKRELRSTLGEEEI